MGAGTVLVTPTACARASGVRGTGSRLVDPGRIATNSTGSDHNGGDMGIRSGSVHTMSRRDQATQTTRRRVRCAAPLPQR